MKLGVARPLMRPFLAGTSRGEIDLSQIPSVRELQGCKFPQLEFRNNGGRITYEPPRGWTYQARDKYTLALTPSNKDLVSVKIKFIPTPGTLVLDQAQLECLKETANSLLPPASKLSVEPVVTPNPLRINDHPTCEVVVTFELHAQRLRMSVLFVDLGESQLRFSLISRPDDDFEPLHKAFQDSWFSWHGRVRWRRVQREHNYRRGGAAEPYLFVIPSEVEESHAVRSSLRSQQ